MKHGAVALRLELVLPAKGIEHLLETPFPGEIVDVQKDRIPSAEGVLGLQIKQQEAALHCQ